MSEVLAKSLGCAKVKALPPFLKEICAAQRSVENIVREGAATNEVVFQPQAIDRIWPFLPKTYIIYSFVLPNCASDIEDSLKFGLRRCLQSSSPFAFLGGRYSPKSQAIIDTNAGVPFTTIRINCALPWAEPWDDESLMCYLADLRRSADITSDSAPPMTVTLALFSSGAILTISTHHLVMDGEASMSFVQEWASYCRGTEPTVSSMASRVARTRTALPIIHAFSVRSWFLGNVFSCIDGQFVRSVKALQTGWNPRCHLPSPAVTPRRCVALSADSIKRLKAAASPVPPGWVSTQEVLSAYLLLSLWQATARPMLPASIQFAFAGRKYFDEADIAGNYAYSIVVVVPIEVLGAGLQAVTVWIHDSIAKHNNADSAKISYAALAATKGDFISLLNLVQDGKAYACELIVNNLSKTTLPVFGCQSAAASCFVKTGPTLLLSGSGGGIRVFLQQGRFLPSGVTAFQWAQAMKGLHPF